MDAFIVAVTGYGEEQVKQRCIEAGFNFHLLKPISTEWLLGYLRDKLALRQVSNHVLS